MGRRLFSVRVTATDSNKAFAGTDGTAFGAWTTDTCQEFLASPMPGRASTSPAVARFTTRSVAAG
jgi:hypothetical protein